VTCTGPDVDLGRGRWLPAPPAGCAAVEYLVELRELVQVSAVWRASGVQPPVIHTNCRLFQSYRIATPWLWCPNSSP
jgi:hypothetical protein